SWPFLSSRFHQTHQRRTWGPPLLELSCLTRSLLTIPPTVPTADLPVIHDDTPLIPNDTPTTSPITTIAGPMLTARKRVGPLPTHRLALRYSADYSSSDHFTSNDSLRDSPSDSSLETSSDSHSDTSSDSSLRHYSLGHPISDSPCDSPTTTSVGPSHKRCRLLTTSVPIASPVPGALPPVRADLLLPHKRIRDLDPVTDFEDREINIDACIAFADEIVARRTDVRVEELYDHMVEIPVHRVKVIESVQRDQGYRIVATSQQSAAMSERIGMLEWDNMRLRGMLGVERQIVDRLRRMVLPCIHVNLESSYKKIKLFHPTLSVEEALKAYDAARNPITKIEMEGEQQDNNVEVNGNNGNGNGNGDGNPNVNNESVVPVTRECTYQDFVKCQLLNFKGTEVVVGLTRGFEKMEMVFYICNSPPKYQVKYASCTLLNGALTLWNSHISTVRVDAAYAMTWKALMKIMTHRFQKLTLLCIKMVLKEEDKVEKYIGGLPDNIQGKNAKNKIRFNNNPRDKRGQQQQLFKRQNVNGQNVARAYMVGNNIERKAYAGALPYYSKCRMHHECGNYKRVGHLTRDCRTIVIATPQRAPVGIRQVLLDMSVEDKEIME
ncbi:hypothetical protein Tco_0746789, partial [Tanacetum coccineum]